MKKLLSILIGLSLIAGACAKNGIDADSISSEDSSKGTCFNPGISAYGADFQAYLNKTANGDLTGFGGSSSITGDCAVTKQPVIFLHGNADNSSGSALPPMGGWKASRDYFLSKGYKPTELYAVDFGLAGVMAAGGGSLNYHSPSNLSKIYRFITAVKNYTGASKVDIIAHSLGVTSARRAVKGGTYCDSLSCVSLGASLNSSVDAFVGIAGGNRGLNSCGIWPLSVWTPTCGPHGFSIGNPFLSDLNGGYSAWFGYLGSNWKMGSYTYTIVSYVDELTCLPVMPTTCYIWGVHTSKMKGETGSKAYYSSPYGHMGLKNLTTAVQYNMVSNHTY